MVMFCDAGACAHIVTAASTIAAASSVVMVKVRMMPTGIIAALFAGSKAATLGARVLKPSVQQKRTPAIHERGDIGHQPLLDHSWIVTRFQRVDHLAIPDELLRQLQVDLAGIKLLQSIRNLQAQAN